MEGYDFDLVGQLAKDSIKPLLEHLLVNLNAKGLLKESEETKEKKHKKEGKICRKITGSRRAIQI